MAVRVKLRFGGSFVDILEEQVGNVALCGGATCVLGVDFYVIPLKVYAVNCFFLMSSVMV